MEETRQGFTAVAKPTRLTPIVATATQPNRRRHGYTQEKKREFEGRWYMQGASPVEERLRFEWTPILVWKVRPTGEIQAICYGWSRTVHLSTKGGQILDEWDYTFYYDRPAKQDQESSFDDWLGHLYNWDLPYLNNSLWEWVQQKFSFPVVTE